MNAMKFSLCVPVYNEAAVIADTARTLHQTLTRQLGTDGWELLLIDDGSTDGSGEIIASLNLPHVRLLAYRPNRGKGAAVRLGMLEADGDAVMFLDADLAYGTEVIGQAISLLETRPDASVIIGSRAIHPDGYSNYTLIRKLASKTCIILLQRLGHFPYSDCQCGCKVFRKDAAREIFRRCRTDGFAFDFEALLWARKLGYVVVEMPVRIVNHHASKVNVFLDGLRMLREFLRIQKLVGIEK